MSSQEPVLRRDFSPRVTRDKCCADRSKPCSYHEGFQDAIDTISESQERVAEAARPLAHCFTPVDRPATPEEVDDGCELGIWFDPCGHCSGCRLAAALEALNESPCSRCSRPTDGRIGETCEAMCPSCKGDL